MSIKVVDLNEEATETKDEPPAIEQVGDSETSWTPTLLELNQLKKSPKKSQLKLQKSQMKLLKKWKKK